MPLVCKQVVSIQLPTFRISSRRKILARALSDAVHRLSSPNYCYYQSVCAHSDTQRMTVARRRRSHIHFAAMRLSREMVIFTARSTAECKSCACKCGENSPRDNMKKPHIPSPFFATLM